MNAEEMAILESEKYSGDFIPFLKEEPDDDPQILMFKRLHNKLAREAKRKSEEANNQADKLNEQFTPQFRKAKLIKFVPNIITIIFGLLTSLQGFALYQSQGTNVLTPDVIGITSAGMGIFLAGIAPLFSLEDETFHLLLVGRANQDQQIADSLVIKTQLSFLKIELMDLKQNYLKRIGKVSEPITFEIQ